MSAPVYAAAMEIGKALAARETELRGRLASSAELAPIVAALDAVDVDAVVAKLSRQLRESFGYWSDPDKTGEDPPLPIQGVAFSFSDGDHDYAYAYGMTAVEDPALVSDAPGDLDAFSEVGGFDPAPFDALSRQARDALGNDGGPLVLARLAQVLHRALAETIDADELEPVTKTLPLHFYVGEHDLGFVLAYVLADD